MSCLKQLNNFAFVEGDITSAKDVSRVLSTHDVDCVMHFAASSHVQESFDNATTFTHNNVVGTQVLLDCVRRHGRVKRFAHVSTDEVYGETNGELVDESCQFLPTNPYSASKAAAEMYVHAYAKSFKIPTIIIRSNNVYGPCQYPESKSSPHRCIKMVSNLNLYPEIIPRFFSLLSQGKPLTIQGSGLNSRRYLYGADAADAFDLILHKGEIGEAYNVGSSFEVTNLEVAVRMLQAFGHSPQTFQQRLCWTEDRPFNDFDYRVDGSKLQALGWRQRTSFEVGLAATVEWYKKNIGVWWPSDVNAD
jgi:dTDP-glucose 4,6-dehydratase